VHLVIDRFLAFFTPYIDKRDSAASPEVAFVATHADRDRYHALAALFWFGGGDDDIIARLVKTLFRRVFAISLISQLEQSRPVSSRSFSVLGLRPRSDLRPADVLRPAASPRFGLAPAGRCSSRARLMGSSPSSKFIPDQGRLGPG